MRDKESARLLDILWTWKHPKLTLASEQRTDATSMSTRHPEFHDKHLAPQNVLKFVKHLPGVDEVLKNRVDSLVETALHVEKTTEALPKSAEAIQAHLQRYPNQMYNERSVAEFYRAGVFYMCAPIASTLLLHPEANSWDTMLELMRQHGQTPITYSTLRIQDHTGDAHLVSADLFGFLSPAFRELLQHLIDDEALKGWRALVFEFKLPSGGAEVMMAEIDRNARLNIDRRMKPEEFPWKFCPYDKKKPNCKNCEVTNDISDDVLPSDWNELILALSEPPRSDIGNAEAATFGTSEIRWSQERPVSGDPAYNVSTEVTAKQFCELVSRKTSQDIASNFPVKAWVQAVLHDASFILMSAGNSEFIGIRDRKTQTLYVSDLIVPSEHDAYLKLHTGLYITLVAVKTRRKMTITEAATRGGELAEYAAEMEMVLVVPEEVLEESGALGDS